MSREDPQMKIRLPADLKDRIEELSKQAGRSMNAEIVARLQGSLETEAASESRRGNGITSEEKELAERIAEKVVAALRPKGLDLVTGGQPTIKQGLPPDPEAKD